MLQELLKNLTKDQRAALATRGIKRNLLYEWRKGSRLPTEVQTADLATVCNVSYDNLQREVTYAKAPEGVRDRIATALGKARGGAVTLFFGLIAVALGAGGSPPARAKQAAADNV